MYYSRQNFEQLLQQLDRASVKDKEVTEMIVDSIERINEVS